MSISFPFLRLRLRLEVGQKPPATLLLPSLLLPIIRRVGKEFNNIMQTRIVRNNDEDVLVSIPRSQLIDTALRLSIVDMNALFLQSIEGLRRRATRMQLLEDVSWTERRGRRERRFERVWTDLLGKRQVFCWSKLASVVRDVPAEEHELWWVALGSRERGEVLCGMARSGEEVKTAIAVDIVGLVVADLEAGVEVDLDEVTAFPGFLAHRAVRDGWVPGDEVGFELWTDDEIGVGRERGGISSVVLGASNQHLELLGTIRLVTTEMNLQDENDSR